MRPLANLSLLVSTLIATTGVAMSQNPSKQVIAIRCEVLQPEIAQEFSDAFCQSLASSASQRWPDKDIVSAADGVEFDILVSVRLTVVDARSASYQVSWGDISSWDTGTQSSSDTIQSYMNDAQLTTSHANRLMKGVFNAIEVDF